MKITLSVFKKKIASKKECHLLIDLNDLEQFKSEDDKRTILVRDQRTTLIDAEHDYYEVKPIAVRKGEQFLWYVYFVCPVCGLIHVHGLDTQKTEKGVLPVGIFRESRVSHCHECNYHFDFAIA